MVLLAACHHHYYILLVIIIITICLSLQLAAFQKTATHGGLKHAQVLVKGNFIMIIIAITMIFDSIMTIIMIMMIMITMMMKIVLQDTSAWTLEPALMSAMKKTPGPSVNVRSGIIVKCQMSNV